MLAGLQVGKSQNKSCGFLVLRCGISCVAVGHCREMCKAFYLEVRSTQLAAQKCTSACVKCLYNAIALKGLLPGYLLDKKI